MSPRRNEDLWLTVAYWVGLISLVIGLTFAFATGGYPLHYESTPAEDRFYWTGVAICGLIGAVSLGYVFSSDWRLAREVRKSRGGES